MVKPKKYFGQHFLNNPHIAEKIVQSFLKYPQHFTIEIGAGTGVLTEKLIQCLPKKKFVAIDIDEESINYLRIKFPEHSEQFLLEDFLNSNYIQLLLSNQKTNIIGNFPYNISSQILFKVLEHKNNVEFLIGMFQKEVAERICSQPGNKDYGILSVLIQTFYKTSYLFTVNEGSFNPPPKVKSAVISLENKHFQLPVSEKLFFDVVKTAFQQRRKTLRNSLKKWSSTITLPYLDKRPEQLHFEQFIELTSIIEKNL
ncbi:MAG: ribosomal RNA small subunit methyltransferase A [Bacteroidia bacterium]|nr:MAG: ribosomal RNA small subunit methyltransferase A [Bacteroidia bacterium]